MTGAFMAIVACIAVAATWSILAGAQATTTAHAAANGAWSQHWAGIYQCSRMRAQYTAAYVYLDTKTANGIVTKKCLVDLGAAASVIPLSSFSQACLNLNLAPSEATLRGASGHSLPVKGQGDLEFLMPNTTESFQHTMQVADDMCMSEGLRISP